MSDRDYAMFFTGIIIGIPIGVLLMYPMVARLLRIAFKGSQK